MSLLYLAYIEFLEGRGKHGSREEFDSLTGSSLVEVVDLLAKKHQFEATPEDYVSLVERRYLDTLLLFPGAREFLEKASQTYRLALVTSAPVKLVDPFLEKQNLRDFFEVVVTAESAKKSKPSPDLFLYALDQLDMDPSEAIAIEDSENGLVAAEAAGVKTVRFEGDWEPILKKIEAVNE